MKVFTCQAIIFIFATFNFPAVELCLIEICLKDLCETDCTLYPWSKCDPWLKMNIINTKYSEVSPFHQTECFTDVTSGCFEKLYVNQDEYDLMEIECWDSDAFWCNEQWGTVYILTTLLNADNTIEHEIKGYGTLVINCYEGCSDQVAGR